MPLTTPARTLLDLAEVVSAHDLERAVARAEGLRLFDLAAVERVMEAHPARAGSIRLARLLASQDLGDGLTRSELEERVLALCARMGVPRPLVNAVVAGLEVDFYWPASGLVVEADSRRHHLRRVRSSATVSVTRSCCATGSGCSGSLTPASSANPAPSAPICSR